MIGGEPPSPAKDGIEKEPILSFEEFSQVEIVGPAKTKHPHFNNFHVHFSVNSLSEQLYRNTSYFKRLMAEHGDLVASLHEKIQPLSDEEKITFDTLQPFVPELYEAYKLMRSYGASDKDLFS